MPFELTQEIQDLCMVLASVTLDLEQIYIIPEQQLVVTWDISKTQKWY